MKNSTNNIIAHRGAWKEFNLPQNSIAALQKAMALHCYGVECDVHITKDSILVVHHDDDFFDMPIISAIYSELKQKSSISLSVLPLLSEFLELIKHHLQTHLIIELKIPEICTSADKKRFVMVLSALMKDYQQPFLFSFITFDWYTAIQLKKELPHFKISYLNGDKTPEEIKASGLDGVDYHFTRFLEHPDWLEKSRQLELITNTWTVNDPLVFQAFQQQSIDHITTDYPALFLEL